MLHKVALEPLILKSSQLSPRVAGCQEPTASVSKLSLFFLGNFTLNSYSNVRIFNLIAYLTKNVHAQMQWVLLIIILYFMLAMSHAGFEHVRT